MKFKKAIIFICLIVCFLSIACVSAGDVDETIVVGSDGQMIEIENQENVAVAEEDASSFDAFGGEIYEESDTLPEYYENAGSFTDLKNMIDGASEGSTLVLDRDFVYKDDDSDEIYDEGIDITKSITIDGRGHVIDALSQSRIFNIAFGYDSVVVLNNIRFCNGDIWADNGGAICTAYIKKLEINNCEFINNWASDGGAINTGAVTLKTSNCSFVNNSASHSGFNIMASCDMSIIDNCYFTAEGDELSYYSVIIGNANINNCIFENNKNLGALHSWGDNVAITNCIFNNNSVVNPYDGRGGAVDIEEGKVTITNCAFNNNFANYLGGAIYWGGNYGVLSNCSFNGCYVLNTDTDQYSDDAYGGAVCWVGDHGNLNNCNFENCYVSSLGEAYGGAVYWEGYDGVLNASTFRGCEASTIPSDWNEAVYGIDGINCRFLKPNPFISVSPVTVRYGQDATIVVNLYTDVPGNVRFAVNGASEKVKITNGQASYTVSGLNYGLYNVGISYGGNYKYEAQTITTTLKVNKNSPITSVVANNIGYGSDAVITVNLAKNVPGNVKVTVNGETQKVKITNGVSKATFTGLKQGTYDVKATYAGNVNYVAQTKTASFNVVKGSPIISVSAPSVTFGKNAVITVNLHSDVPGNVRFTVNGVTEKAKITNGQATYTISGLKAGSHEVTVYYAGNVNYNAQTIKKNLNIVKANPITSVSVTNINVGDTEVVTVKMASNVNGNVRITVNGVTEKVQIVNGVATLNVAGLKAGTYDVSAVYAGNANFNAQTKTASFEVSKSSPELTVVKRTVEGKTVLIASIAEDATGYVNFAVNGGTYKAKIVNGEATLTLPDFAPGTYTLKSSYGGNYKYLPETKTRTITIK